MQEVETTIIDRMRILFQLQHLLGLGLLALGGAQGSILIEYTANGDPTSQGFLDRGGIFSSTAVSNDLGFDARKISGNSC